MKPVVGFPRSGNFYPRRGCMSLRQAEDTCTAARKLVARATAVAMFYLPCIKDYYSILEFSTKTII